MTENGISQPSEETANKGALLAIFLTVFIDLLGFGIVLPLLPIYAREFTLDESGWTIGLLMASFSAMQFLFAPVWGRISDRVGRRPILLIGLAGSTVFYALFGLATMWKSLGWMFVSRIGAGIAGATISTAQAYIADVTTKEKRTRGMALIGMAFGLGFTLGPLLAAGALLSADSDRGLSPWPGYLASGLSFCAFLFAFFKLKESRKPGGESAERRWFDFGSFREALTIPTIGALLLISFLAILSFASFEGVLSFLLKAEAEDGGFDYELHHVMLLFALLGFIHALAQGMVRSMSKRMPEGKLAMLGTTISVCGFGFLTWATVDRSIAMLILGMLVLSFGFAFIPAAIQALISRRSDPEKQGGILGVGQSLSALARILGHAICIPMFTVSAFLPLLSGVVLMFVALLLVTWVKAHGKDFSPTE